MLPLAGARDPTRAERPAWSLSGTQGDLRFGANFWGTLCAYRNLSAAGWAPGGRMGSVLIPDDHAVIRTGLRVYLEQDRLIDAIAESATGAETLPATAQ